MKTHYQLDLRNTLDANLTISTLEQWGIIRISNYLTIEKTQQLAIEFQTCCDRSIQGVQQFDYSLGQAAKVTRNEIDANILPMTAKVFGDRFMVEITDRYLGVPNLLNHDIYVVKDVVGIEHIAQNLHYDRTPTLKFFLYLNDVTVENGAFHCVPGSHTWTRKQQRKNRARNIRPEEEETRRIPKELAAKAIPIEGEAGTLIIFHTDTLHQAGIIQKGERWVMRGHSRRPQDLQLIPASQFQSPGWQPLEAIRKIRDKLKEIQLTQK